MVPKIILGPKELWVQKIWVQRNFGLKQAQNLCIDASVEQSLTKSKFVENDFKFLEV